MIQSCSHYLIRFVTNDMPHTHTCFVVLVLLYTGLLRLKDLGQEIAFKDSRTESHVKAMKRNCENYCITAVAPSHLYYEKHLAKEHFAYFW